MERATTNKKKKKTSDNTMRLSKKEKDLIKNFRKCNEIEKNLIFSLCEKASGSILDALGQINIPLRNEE